MSLYAKFIYISFLLAKYVLIIPVVSNTMLYAQNLIINSGFEDIKPFKRKINITNIIDGDNIEINDTAPFFSSLPVEKRILCPITSYGWQDENYGLQATNIFYSSNKKFPEDGYCFGLVKFYQYKNKTINIQNLKGTLKESLEKNDEYIFEFYYKYFSGNIKNISLFILLSKDDIDYNNYQLLSDTSKIITQEINLPFDTSNYNKIEFRFIAKGEERFIYAGFFDNKSNHKLKKTSQFGYYKNIENALNSSIAIDNISLEPKYQKQIDTSHKNVIVTEIENSNFPELRVDKSFPSLITLPSDILFAKNEFTLTNMAKEELNNFVIELKNKTVKKLIVKGFTDDDGNEKYNQLLSERRANEVANFLKSKLENTEIQAQGFGEKNPVVNNDTKENKSKNRRVEIEIYSN